MRSETPTAQFWSKLGNLQKVSETVAKRKTAQSKSNGQPSKITDRLDRELINKTLRKVMQGEDLTGPEKTALRKHEKQQEETRRWEYYRTIPQKHYREMSGRQTKVLHDQQRQYGFPIAQATICLPDVLRSFHDFLAANKHKLAPRDDDDLLAGDSSSPALERYREERAILAQLDRLERERALVSRDEIREGLGRIASIIKQAGDTLNRQFGEEAGSVLIEALDDAKLEIDRLVGKESDDRSQPNA